MNFVPSKLNPVLPPDAEITVNLWFIYDPGARVIMGLLYRPYVDSGTEEEKRARLAGLAHTDFLNAEGALLPAMLGTFSVVSTDGSTKRYNGCLISSYEKLGPLSIFEELLSKLEATQFVTTGLRLRKDPVVCITPLALGDDMRLKPTVTRKTTL